MRTVLATRYVTPLREGGSLPAIVEADDDGMYVLKFRGSGQGPKALIAELVAGEIARAAGLSVPEIVFIKVDADLARTEPDPEIQSLIRDSGGLNLGLDYLPGSVGFNAVADKLDPALASTIVWFDAYVTNVDRTPRNTNMLMWHRRLFLIDHGAALYFHHKSENYLERSRDPFSLIKDHVLLRHASALHEADAVVTQRLTPEVLKSITGAIPDEWLAGQLLPASSSSLFSPESPCQPITDDVRQAYLEYLLARLDAPRNFVEEAIRARSERL